MRDRFCVWRVSESTISDNCVFHTVTHPSHIYATAPWLGWLWADFGGGLPDERPTN
jgi:hypothetical protein